MNQFKNFIVLIIKCTIFLLNNVFHSSSFKYFYIAKMNIPNYF